MLVIPAIDLKGGNCVRLVQGDPDRETVYSGDPVAVAREFAALGALLIHVVDLDGAFQGAPVNHETVMEIANSVDIPIEIGGGIRNEGTVQMYLDAGIDRIIMGTAILQEESGSIIERFGDKIIAGVDARDSRVATHGWKNVTDVGALEFILHIRDRGLREFIYTDIATDGMLTGPNIWAYEEILSEVRDIRVVASGGISSLEDLDRLKHLEDKGLKGCITGKAVYDGRLDLKSAFEQYQQTESRS